MAEQMDRSRFNRLVSELLSGSLRRNAFQRWEVDLFVQFDACEGDRATKRQLLKRYQKAANRQWELGERTIAPFSTYIAARRLTG